MTEFVKHPKITRIFSRVMATATFIAAMGLQACGSGSGEADQPIGFSYVPELNAVYQPFEPTIGAAVPVGSGGSMRSADLPYPPFNAHDIKAIGPDSWRDRDQLVNAGVGGVIFNQLWSTWQPSANLSLNDPNTFEYDGMVWQIDPVREKQIRWYSARGIKVTAVLFATPEWARQGTTQRVGDVPLVNPKFIAPDNPADFARFAGMLAKRYNGANGNGRIVNFIIQNEVNALDWYNPGCGAPEHPCDIQDRINSYATIYNMAYDRILQEQSQAHVFFSFDHHFGAAYNDNQRFSSAQRFIETLDPLVSPRQWRVAYHSYPSDLYNPTFGPYDYPKVTFGNLGVLAGFLRQRFPTKPHAWDIHLTENGLNAGTPSSEELQKNQMNIATRNVIGTPGISNYVYHRMRDHYQEGNFQPGLHDIESNPKAGWYTWSTNNLYRQSPKKLAGGYEDLPYLRVVRSVHPDIGHWASTRQAPQGYNAETSFLLLREQQANTTMLYECHVSGINVTRLSRDISCSGEQNFGPVGYIYNFNTTANSRLPLYTINNANTNHILTTNPDELPGEVTQLGYIDATKVLSQPIPKKDLSYFDTRYGTGSYADLPSQTAPDQIINNIGDCSDTTQNCSYIRFAVSSGLSNTLHCSVQGAAQGVAKILVNHGNDTVTRAVNVDHVVNPFGDTYTLPLPISDSATWASVVLSSTDFASTNHCVVVQGGQLQIGAALDLNNNLLQNGSFEADLTDWEQCADDTSVSFSEVAHEGLRSISVGNGNCIYQEVSVDEGVEYKLDCQAQHAGPGVGSVKLGFANGSFQKLGESELPVSTASFENYSASGVAPAGSVYAVVTFLSGVGTGLLDSCSLIPVE